MTQHSWLDPSPFFFAGGPVGVLLIHGFTGAPTEMRPLGEFLAAQNHTVSGLLLPGHGTSVEDLAGRTWPEWVAAVEQTYRELAGRCKQVFVAGLSLGSLLTLNLAAAHPVDGIALYSPAIFFADRLMSLSWIATIIPLTIRTKDLDADLVDPAAGGRIWCYDAIPGRAAHQVNLFNKRVRKLLPSITAPALVVMSTGDNSIRYKSGPHVIQQIGSSDKELVTLHDSGHNILCDGERELVWQQTAAFIARLAAGEQQQ